MDSRSNDGGFASNNSANTSNDMFANNQQYNAYDNLNLFQNGTNPNFNDASWGVNASAPQNASRGQHPVPSWQQNANHLSAPNAYNGQSSPYGRSLNQSPASYGQNNFTNNTQQPQQYQYRQPQINQSIQAFNNAPVRAFNSPAQNGGTITPQVLDRVGQPTNYPNNPYASNAYQQSYGQIQGGRPVQAMPQTRPIDPKALAAAVPKGVNQGMFSVLDFGNLSQATNSERMGHFVNIGKDALEWGCSRGVVPTCFTRKSRNDWRALAGNNPAALAKIGKKSSKMSSSTSASSPQIKYEQDSTSTEESSSDDSDTDTSDDETDSPLPARRPENPKEGVEYDTIKALWRSKRKALNSESIRKGLVDFWELIKVIRDRWKADSAAVTEAEEKKRAGELPLLQSRVKDQRDMMEAAFKAALKHGHRGIVELLGENVSLVFLCYQFLLERWKADDVNCGLCRSILETMSLFITLTDDKIEKTHIDKVIPRYLKKGDAKTQHYVRKIVANAETATKDAASKEQKKTEKGTASSNDAKAAVAAKKTGSEPVAGVKRPATASSADGTAAKKVAVGGSKPNGTTAKINGVVKKPVSASDASKPAAAAIATKKTVVTKPSGFFSSLQSASKKPGTSAADKANASSSRPAAAKPGIAAPVQKPAFSFAETMANLTKPKEEKPAPKAQKEIPNETPEERAKRLRKEERRKLHVQFKPSSELEEIRYFTHDPEEEIDQGSSQKRDVGDVGGEGRMFKQQAHMMDLDDEDEGTEESENLKDYKPPPPIDFSVVDKEERKRNYERYGGGEVKVESEERGAREFYENNNLIAIYTDQSQIPSNPKEPIDPYTGIKGSVIKYFGPPEEKFAARARAKKAQHQAAQPPYFGQQMPSYQAGAPATPDIQSILASLAQAAPNPAQEFMQPPQPPPPPMGQPPPPPVPGANLDLAAILASLNPNQQGAGYGAPSAGPMMGFPQQPPQIFGGNNQDDDKPLPPNYKTRPCRFFPQGKCKAGAQCSWLHE